MGENERAWVGPVTAGFKNTGTLTLNAPETIVVQYHNTGRTPAVGAFYRLDYQLISIADDQSGKSKHLIDEYAKDCLAVAPQAGWPTFFPGSGFSNYIEGTQIPKDVIDWGVLYGVKFVVLVGCFAYETNNGPHHTAFCFYFQNGKTDPGAWSFCRMGNYTD